MEFIGPPPFVTLNHPPALTTFIKRSGLSRMFGSVVVSLRAAACSSVTMWTDCCSCSNSLYPTLYKYASAAWFSSSRLLYTYGLADQHPHQSLHLLSWWSPVKLCHSSRQLLLMVRIHTSCEIAWHALGQRFPCKNVDRITVTQGAISTLPPKTRNPTSCTLILASSPWPWYQTAHTFFRFSKMSILNHANNWSNSRPISVPFGSPGSVVESQLSKPCL